ncbi:MAG: prepilin peptidase, partial [Erysipelotrichaceae bacterium]|nr:prepilin peptidase [Erysipelotrichaceae bacterium]
MEAVMVFFIGSVIGSFLNVMVIRSEQGRDFVFSFSQCPACGKRIRFYDLIPIISWLLLRGRCRHCRARISLRYPLVELIGGFSALWCWRYGEVMNQYVSFAYLMILLCIALSDQDCQEIPVCYLIY